MATAVGTIGPNTLPGEQGDILFIPLQNDVTPYGRTVEPRNGRLIVAEGESTGHTHGFDVEEGGPEVTMFVQTEYGRRGRNTERTFIRVTGGTATLTHDEHGAIDFEPGTYEVRFQEEHVPNQGRQRVWD
jgi:hypothetical protein